jgi:hypothetical protein
MPAIDSTNALHHPNITGSSGPAAMHLFNPFYPPQFPMPMSWPFAPLSIPSDSMLLNKVSTSPQKTLSRTHSSDHDQLNYPLISTFLATLVERNPRRSALADSALVFERLDFYNIDEVADFSEGRLTADEFRLSPGNAQFLLKEVKAEMKRVGRMKRARVD